MKESGELKEIFTQFFHERNELQSRTILFEQSSDNMTSDWNDLLYIKGKRENGLTIETSIESYSYWNELLDEIEGLDLNSIGEQVISSSSNIFTAEQLYSAIKEVTVCESDCRWENIPWTWQQFISNLKPDYLDLSSDLQNIVEKKGLN